MRSLGSSGVWELFVPGIGAGSRYKYEIRHGSEPPRLKADPLAEAAELPPANGLGRLPLAARVGRRRVARAARRTRGLLASPISIYEVHLGSWRRNPLEGNRSLTYLELADELAAYVIDLGFTHVELLPVMEHPFAGSWGYQMSGYYAPTSRFGSPDDFRRFVDRLHQAGLGVILDWVPAHFPRDDWALARFDGTALYEHADPRRGAHPDWGTLVFNYGRTEVRNFLVANALYWLRASTPTGCASTPSPRCSTATTRARPGEWIPNRYGGNEDLEAIAFLRELNEVTHGRVPGRRSWRPRSRPPGPGVSRPTSSGGLGFGFKWNMGWMHDTLDYFQHDPIHRAYHHDQLTFGLLYAFTENFVLPLSHDEVVHGKGSLLSKMPGDRSQQLANLRALYALHVGAPGQEAAVHGRRARPGAGVERTTGASTGTCSSTPGHAGVQRLVRDLNRLYRAEPALWERDFEPSGFRWLEAGDGGRERARLRAPRRPTAAACSSASATSPTSHRTGYRVGVPRGGALARDPEHRRRALRRLERRTERGRHGGGAAVARPAVVGRADAAAARRWSGSSRRANKRPAGESFPARCDVGRRGNELLALLRARRAGRALPVRRGRRSSCGTS